MKSMTDVKAGDWLIRKANPYGAETTIGKLYQVVRTDDSWFYIIKDNGVEDGWMKAWANDGWEIDKNKAVLEFIKDL